MAIFKKAILAFTLFVSAVPAVASQPQSQQEALELVQTLGQQLKDNETKVKALLDQVAQIMGRLSKNITDKTIVVELKQKQIEMAELFEETANVLGQLAEIIAQFPGNEGAVTDLKAKKQQLLTEAQRLRDAVRK